MNRKNGLNLQREGEMGELPPEDRLSALFVTEESVESVLHFRETGFLFKWLFHPKHKNMYFFLLACNGV